MITIRRRRSRGRIKDVFSFLFLNEMEKLGLLGICDMGKERRLYGERRPACPFKSTGEGVSEDRKKEAKRGSKELDSRKEREID